MSCQDQIQQSRLGKSALALATSAQKKQALEAMAAALREQADSILQANALDMAAAQGQISPVMQDRLFLDNSRIEGMAQGVLAVSRLPDPIARVISSQVRSDGLRMEKIASPMGVIAIIYESRPNVTSDAAALAIQAGSACILRCGKEAHGTATAIVHALQQGLQQVGFPPEVLTLLEDTSRASATALMKARGYVDLLIPRGGKGLISTCVQEAIVPVLETGTGICHGFVDASAELEMAWSVIENAKASRPSVCNSLEVCLVHSAIAQEFLTGLWHKLGKEREERGVPSVALRVDDRAKQYLSGDGITLASPADFHQEFLDYILAVKVVDSVEEAISHIASHSTGHSEVIFSQDADNIALFTKQVDSAALYVNASTRFTDGGEFGLGCEMGISTQKLHARGPLGLEELCSFKYVLTGSGQIRV